MSEHLSPEQLEQLGAYLLKGDALLEALKHVEECEECRSKIESPSPAELIDQLFRDESEDDADSVGNSGERIENNIGWRTRLKKLLRGQGDFKLFKSYPLFFSLL